MTAAPATPIVTVTVRSKLSRKVVIEAAVEDLAAGAESGHLAAAEVAVVGLLVVAAAAVARHDAILARTRTTANETTSTLLVSLRRCMTPSTSSPRPRLAIFSPRTKLAIFSPRTRLVCQRSTLSCTIAECTLWEASNQP